MGDDKSALKGQRIGLHAQVSQTPQLHGKAEEIMEIKARGFAYP